MDRAQKIQSLIERRYRRLFLTAVAIAFVLVSAISFYYQSQRLQTAVQLLRSQVYNSLNSAEHGQRLIYFQGEYLKTIESVESIYGTKIGSEVRYKGSVIGKSRREFVLSSINYEVKDSLLSGAPYFLTIQIDVLTLIWRPVLLFLLITFCLAVLFQFLLKSQDQFLGEFIIPLERYVIEIDQYTQKLTVDSKGSLPSINRKVGEIESLATSILRLVEKISHLEKTKVSLSLNKAKYEIARLVAHDIRSPVGALQIVGQRINWGSEQEKKLFLSAVDRIQVISQDILGAKVGNEKEIELLEVRELIDSCKEIVLEKKVTNTKHDIVLIEDEIDKNRFVNVLESEWRRVVSNLLNNAIESNRGDSCEVRVTITADGNQYISISIMDRGRGIPDEVLSKLGQEEISFEKEGGSGLGFISAKRFAESCGGSISVKSEMGEGTTVELKLRMA